MKVRRAMQGLYAITAGALRFELARSEDDPRRWQLCPRSTEAYKALGEPGGGADGRQGESVNDGPFSAHDRRPAQ